MSPEEIRLLRQELGLSQRKLAQLLDVSHTSVQRWERGETVPPKMKVDLMSDLRRRARQKKREGVDPNEWIQALLAMAAGGLFGAMLGKIYKDFSGDAEEANDEAQSG